MSANDRSNHEFTTPIEEIRNKDQLEKELCRFIVVVRRDIALTGEQCKHKFPQSYKTIEGKLRDMKRKGLIKKNSAESLSTDEIKQMLNHRLTSRDAAEGLVRRIFKNDQGGLSGSSDCLEIPCPCDEPGILGPFYDFNLYISKRQEKCETKKFYLQVTSNSAISINNWYLDRRMKSEKIKSYLKTICIDVGIDVQDRKIVNHSRRSLFDMAILALDTNKSTDINEINNQAVNNKNAVIIDLKDSYELPKENDVSTSKITQVIEGSSMDLNSEIINKLNINNDKLIDNSNSNCSKRMGGINKIDKHYSNKPIQKTQIT
ncbi:4777_t:CDS:2 [Entrophospora sp. SA101]|nr:22058_t:CDS:2 [Entrophospora sp. SA101]CAJ0832807.1 4777_t:CDS:2 [Entrophospora sp. SA101]